MYVFMCENKDDDDIPKSAYEFQ